MRANELRIGNYVYAQSGKLVVNRDSIYKVENVNIQSARKYEPIPLTEEWLLKFGFELKNWGIKVWYLNGFEIDQHFYLKGIDWGVRFKHVHQLQNLYFALTGDEL